MPPTKSNPSAIGLMDGAFFVSRGELLGWLNNLLQLDYTKVEQISTGAAMCQVMDAIYPGSVNLKKVNFGAKTEYDSIKNWKVLQGSFNRKDIDKHVDVDKLIKGKYQDNLEFFQWMKRFYDMTAQGDYDAASRRSESGAAVPRSSAAAPKPAPSSSKTAQSGPKSAQNGPKTAQNGPKTAQNGAAKGLNHAGKTKENRAPKRVAAGAGARGAADASRLRELNDQVVELKLAKDGLEKERDFYFGKLRDIEIYLQSLGEDAAEGEIAKHVFAILYATEDDFVAGEEAEVEAEAEAEVGQAEGIVA